MALGVGQEISIIIRARDRFTKVFNKASLSISNFRRSALGAAAVGAVIAVGFGKAIKTSIDFESAFTGVRKTVELSEKEFAELEKRFKTVSVETGTTFVELSRIGELAGQLGVQGVDNLSKFTRVIADISVTTNLTAEAAATDFARIANVMQEPLENIDRMASTVVDLGNNFATTEAEITTFAKRIAGAGRIVGFSTADVFSLGAALSSVGIQAEAGGTAVQMAMLKMNDAAINGGEVLEVFAKTAGITADEFSKKWETDAAGAFEDFIIGLGAAGDEASSILQAVGLGSVRAQRAFLSLAGAGDLVTRAFKRGSIASEENTAAVIEAEKRYATLERQIAKAKAKFAILADEIGDRLAPFIKDFLLPALDKLINFWTNLSPQMQNIILILGGVTVAVTILGAAVALIMLVMSPWLLIIGAVILAITAIILIIKNWDEIINKIMTSRLGPFIKFLKNIFSPVIELIKLQITLLGIAFKFLWEKFIKPVFDKMKVFVSFLKEEVLPIILKIISAIGKIAGGIGAGISRIRGIVSGGVQQDFISRPGQGITAFSPNDTIIGTKRGMVGGIVINIENVNGLDPDAVAEALQDILKTEGLT